MKLASDTKLILTGVVVVGVAAYFVGRKILQSGDYVADAAKSFWSPPEWARRIDKFLGIGEYYATGYTDNDPPPVNDVYPDESLRGSANKRPVHVPYVHPNTYGNDDGEGVQYAPDGISP